MALDSMRVGAPRLVAGEGGLDRPVRWVHSAEVPDIASLLRGGELVLTTGIGLPADDAGIRAFIQDLAEVGVAGLVVELGRRYAASVPRVMVAAAQKLGLPLIELRRPTPFVRITEAVHALIVDSQLTELRATEEIHQRFTELSVEGAEPAEVVHQAAQLSGCPVVLENLARQVLAFDAAGDRAEMLLDSWEQHSRRISTTGRTGYDADAGWLTTMVGARGQDWGRLLLRFDGPQPPTRLVIVLERAASTLALGRLIQRDAEGLERQLHGTLLSALLEHTLPVDEVALRARALGVMLDRRRLVGVAVRLRQEEPADDGLRNLAEAVSHALRESAMDGLTSPLDGSAVGALIGAKPGTDENAMLAEFAASLRRRAKHDLIVAAGSGVDSLREARRSLIEARQVAEAARHDPATSIAVVHRLPNVGLAGLLFLLRDEPRLQIFVERQLGSLLQHDSQHPKEPLLPTLRTYLEHGRNKSTAAVAAHMSRPAFYDRLAKIGRILQADLESVSVCLSLHVALVALDAMRNG